MGMTKTLSSYSNYSILSQCFNMFFFSQLVESLTKYSQLSRDRQLLAREVEFLRTQMLRANQKAQDTEPLRLNSSPSKALVDDILNSLTKDERDGTVGLIPQLQLQRRLEEDPTEKVSDDSDYEG